MFIHLPLIRGLLDFCNGLYAKATYATGYVPTYPCGQIGYLLASKNQVSFFRILSKFYCIWQFFFV